MRKIILICTVLGSLFHSGLVVATDKPYLWYDKYSEIQVYNSKSEMVDDIVKYHVDNQWYSSITNKPVNPNNYNGYSESFIK